MSKVVRDRFSQDNLRTFFFLGVFFVASTMLLSVPRLMAPLAFAYVLNLMFSPMHHLGNKFKLSKSLMAVIAIIFLISVIVLPLYLGGPVINEELQNLTFNFPSIELTLREKFIHYATLVKLKVGFEVNEKYFDDAIKHTRNALAHIVLALPTYLASFLEWLFVVPLFLYFFIKSGKKFRVMVLKLAPNMLFERVYYFVFHFNKKIGDYVFAKFIEAAIVGIIIITGLLFFKIKFAIILGILAAVTNIIPYVGPLLGMVPAIILTFSEYGHGPELIVVITLFCIANVIDLAIVFPVLVSKIVDLHPIVVVVSVIIGSQYFGLVGMVISVPAVAALKLIFVELYRTFYLTSD